MVPLQKWKAIHSSLKLKKEEEFASINLLSLWKQPKRRTQKSNQSITCLVDIRHVISSTNPSCSMSLLNSIFDFLRFNRRNWRAIALCFFAAAVFWIFNALNKRYTTNVNFPLAFEYNEENYIAVRPLPSDVRLNVTGLGWNLFRRSIGLRVPPLVIPLDKPTEVRKIVGGTLPALFANQLEGCDINFVLTDTLQVALEAKSRRWVSLRLETPSD